MDTAIDGTLEVHDVKMRDMKIKNQTPRGETSKSAIAERPRCRVG